ncbi:hypothetical protein ACKWTF_016606 [Chironomus riparius]
MAEKSGSVNIPAWNDEAKAAFNDFKKRKRTLPFPPNSNQAKDFAINSKRFDLRNVRLNSQVNKRKNIFDLNRGSTDSNALNDESSFRNSTLSDTNMSVDIECESELDRTEVICEEIEKNVALVRDMIKNKGDTYEILDKLTNDFAEFYKKSREMFQKISSDNAGRINRMNNQIVALENNVYEKIDAVYEQSDERITAIEISNKCSKETSILWISFTDPKEIESLRLKNKHDLIRETKNIFSRMNIWLNSVNRQIIDVLIQKVSVRTDQGYKNEIVLGVRFINNLTVQELSRLIMDFAKKQFVAKNYDTVRYTVRDNWSPMIWKILRVCYDLSSFNLIEKANVGESGIIVRYKTVNLRGNESDKDQLAKSVIRNESDLNELRRKVGDVGCELPTFRVYDGNYFKLSPPERKLFKDNLKRTLSSDNPVPPVSSPTETQADINATSSN